MKCLPHSPAERLLASALLALAVHLAAYLLLEGLPVAQQDRLGLRVHLAVDRPQPGAAAVAARPTGLPAPPSRAEGAPAQPASASAIAEPRDLPASGVAAESEASAPSFDVPALLEDDAFSVARYYLASELDVLAEPVQPVSLPPTETEVPDDAVLELYIDYQGWVQRVVVPATLDPAYAAQLQTAFMGARFVPAIKDGQAVNSLKRIALLAETL